MTECTRIEITVLTRKEEFIQSICSINDLMLFRDGVNQKIPKKPDNTNDLF